MAVVMIKDTHKNRIRAYRSTDFIFIGLAASAAVVWYMREKPAPALTPIEAQVADILESIESLDAQQKGTYDYLLEQSQELKIQFDKLSIGDDR